MENSTSGVSEEEHKQDQEQQQQQQQQHVTMQKSKKKAKTKKDGNVQVIDKQANGLCEKLQQNLRIGEHSEPSMHRNVDASLNGNGTLEPLSNHLNDEVTLAADIQSSKSINGHASEMNHMIAPHSLNGDCLENTMAGGKNAKQKPKSNGDKKTFEKQGHCRPHDQTEESRSILPSNAENGFHGNCLGEEHNNYRNGNSIAMEQPCSSISALPISGNVNDAKAISIQQQKNGDEQKQQHEQQLQEQHNRETDPPNGHTANTNTDTATKNDSTDGAAGTATDNSSKESSASIRPSPALDLSNVHIDYKEYESELQMHDIMRLIQAELSEPYSIYTYRYFIYNWPNLCFLAAHGNEYVGAIVCKLDMHMNVRRGYIAMLAVRKEYRKLKIGTTLVQKAIEAMLADNADEVVLETEMRNVPALRLYENLGFVRDKRLFRYYLNGVDALRLKLWFR